MPSSPVQIRLDEVDRFDVSFVVSYGFDLGRLQASIKALGLLSPPLLRRRPDGRYQIVCGYQRVLVLEQMGRVDLPVLVMPEETPALWCLQASVQDNIFGRGFNPVEAALIVDRLLTYLDEETVRQVYLPMLGLPASKLQLRKSKGLLGLEAPWLELVAHNRLSPEAAAELGQWTAVDRAALLPWFQTVNFSHSKQLELYENLTTLSRRAGNSPAAWLKRPELLALLTDPVLSKAEKSSRLLEMLREWCFPQASQTRQQFHHYLKALRLYQHPEMRLIPAPAFEDSALRLELRFQSKSQLARQLQQVLQMLGRPEFDALLNL